MPVSLPHSQLGPVRSESRTTGAFPNLALNRTSTPVALALVGFFLGPVTPKVLAAIGVRVPPSLKGSVVSLLVGTGASGSLSLARDPKTRRNSDTSTATSRFLQRRTGLVGSSVGPLLFGVVAGRGGLSSLPAVMIGVSVFSIGAWLAVPKNRRRED